jgi:EsV-1-7 cysteine-rich motif
VCALYVCSDSALTVYDVEFRIQTTDSSLLRATCCPQRRRSPFTSAFCIAEGCLKRPSFGLAGDRRALYCIEHADEHPEIGLVNVSAKTCEVESCTTQPAFGFSTDKIRRRCKAHRLPGMTNVAQTLCESCNKRIRTEGYMFDHDKVCLESCMCSAHSRSDCIATVTPLR